MSFICTDCIRHLGKFDYLLSAHFSGSWRAKSTAYWTQDTVRKGDVLIQPPFVTSLLSWKCYSRDYFSDHVLKQIKLRTMDICRLFMYMWIDLLKFYWTPVHAVHNHGECFLQSMALRVEVFSVQGRHQADEYNLNVAVYSKTNRGQDVRLFNVPMWQKNLVVVCIN